MSVDNHVKLPLKKEVQKAKTSPLKHEEPKAQKSIAENFNVELPLMVSDSETSSFGSYTNNDNFDEIELPSKLF